MGSEPTQRAVEQSPRASFHQRRRQRQHTKAMGLETTQRAVEQSPRASFHHWRRQRQRTKANVAVAA